MKKLSKSELILSWFEREFDVLQCALAVIHNIPTGQHTKIKLGYNLYNKQGKFSWYEFRKGMLYQLPNQTTHTLVKWDKVKEEIYPMVKHWWTRDTKILKRL